MSEPLSLSAQTTYAQLLEACQSGDFLRTVAHLPGSFSTKIVKGIAYWYFRYCDLGGKLQEVYLGPDLPDVRALTEKKAMPAADLMAIGGLALAAAALGCTSTPQHQFRVIERLADYGFFRAGGVLVGTHAFLGFGNMLGVRWVGAQRTEDVDFAHAGKNVSLAMKSDLQVDTPSAIESLSMGFLPVSTFGGKSGGSFLNPKEPGFRLDFLTTLHCGGALPYTHKQLGISLQPLRFMEFSLENIQQAVFFCGKSAIITNVPDPARYAIHKLLIVSEREGAFAAKIDKDLAQAAALIRALSEKSPWFLENALSDAQTRGPTWKKNLKAGVLALERKDPVAASTLRSSGFSLG